MYPSLETVKQLASQGDYKRIPVCRELFSDKYTPVEVMRMLKKASHHCYLLESASQSEAWGRYSFLGYDPVMEITCSEGEMKIRHTGENGNQEEKICHVTHPGETLRQVLDQYKSPKVECLPTFTGGLVGYFSYDYIRYSEPKLKLGSKGQQDFRDMDLMLFDQVIAFDHYRQKLLLITGVKTENIDISYQEAQKKLQDMADLIKKEDKMEFPPIHLLSEIQPELPEKEYCQIVERAKQYIKEGDIFQVVLSNPMRAKAEGSLFDTYRVLRATNPSPYMFYFSSDDIEIAGASPETLVKLDEKELAEHNMLVDLGRNDIGKISKIGTVQVEKYLDVERYSCVMHLGSTVIGQIRDDKDAVNAVDAILPAGTLSGAPKFRACQIIDELEKSKRGIYGGAIGYMDFTGNLDVCIAIRLVYKKNGEICIRSGAGIVADSVPEKEFMECKNKAKAVVRALAQAEEGIQ